MTPAPDVSIVIPVFNRLELTRACLASLAANLSAATVEIVIVDNGSTDGSTEWLRERERAGALRLVVAGENLGFARGSNAGAAIARGRHLLLLNNDTEGTPGWLEPLLDTLDRDPRVGAVGARLLFPDGTIQHAGVAILDKEIAPGRSVLCGHHLGYKQPADEPAYNRPRTCQALTAACLLVRGEAWRQVGGLDADYWNGNEDVDLCFRLREREWRLVYQPASVVLHHESESGPERWSKVRDNLERLDRLWRGRVQPDYRVAPDGRATDTGAGGIAPYVAPSFADPETPVADREPTVSIVVLTWNALAYTKQCVRSVLAHTDPRHELIMVDNGSTDGTPAWLEELAGGEGRVRVILNRENRGFAAGNNQGIAAARGDHVVLLNSDAVVTPGWLDRLLDALVREPRAGLLGPVTNCISGPQQLAKVTYDPVSLEGLDEFATERAQSRGGKVRELLSAVGFCLLIRREVLLELGGLDEGFGQGNYEDTDYCLRALLAGWRTFMVEDSYVHHFGSRSFVAAGVDYARQIEDRFAIFKRKWDLPAEARQGGPLPLETLVGDGFVPGLHTETLACGPRIEPLLAPEWDLDRRVAAAETAFAAGRLGAAECLLESVLAVRPDDTRADSDLAVVLWQRGEIAAAVARLEAILARDPDHADARHNLVAITAATAHA